MLGAAQGANMYLNGWQRIWLVASVCWIIGGSLWIHSFAIDDAHTGYEICFHSRSEGRSAENCESKYAANLHAVVADPYHWLYTAALTLIPIPIVWLIVYGLVALVRWIKAGFAPKPG